MAFNFLKAPPPASLKISNPVEVDRQYKHWRVRILYSLTIGYALFYLIRLNLPTAIPFIQTDLGFSKTQIGLITTVFGIVYGFSKFINGLLGDRSNMRYFMPIGLMLAAISVFCFGLSSSYLLLLIFWAMNGWFSGMGWPPCARGLTQWFSVSERGTFWGIWNTSHMIGGAAIFMVAGYIITYFGWRYIFFIPAVICFLMGFFIINRLRDTPQSLGLPAVEIYKNEPTGREHLEETQIPFKEILLKHVLNNPFIWVIAIANFFVYVVRWGALTWAVTFLFEVKGAPITSASVKGVAFELMGLIGSLSAGYLSDRFAQSRRGPINTIYMLVLIPAILVFWLNPPGQPIIDLVALGFVGFFVYGPQMLVGVAAADLAGKHAAATATGFTGWFGYLGQVLSGVVMGWMVDHYGWDGGFILLTSCAVIGVLCFATTWWVRPFGYNGASGPN